MMVAVPAGAASDRFSGNLKVVDGDTFDVGGQRVRLHGIDAPEHGQPCRQQGSQDFDCGVWVTQKVRALLEGRQAVCDGIERDRYGRTVAQCRLGGRDIGQWLVEEGLAFAYRRYSMAYDLDEKAALTGGRGLHRFDLEAPSAYRRAASAPAGCVIKGNLSRSGQIYHVPGQRDYDRTRITTADGERWFCTEAAARAAGWRRAKR